MVRNFTNFGPVGIIVVAMIGVADRKPAATTAVPGTRNAVDYVVARIVPACRQHKRPTIFISSTMEGRHHGVIYAITQSGELLY